MGRARGRPAAAADLQPALIVDKVRQVRLHFQPISVHFHLSTFQFNSCKSVTTHCACLQELHFEHHPDLNAIECHAAVETDKNGYN